MSTRCHRFFLGGHDLEMVTIRDLLREAGLADAIEDKGLAWGAKASRYADEIRASLARGETPVLIELDDDLDAQLERSRLVFADHHGARAGVEAPSALRQIYDLLPVARRPSWTRWLALVEANDVGHAEALRAMGASPAEIVRVRDADRRAQGIGAETERESRRAVQAMVRRDGLAVIATTAATASAVADFLLPEYGGPGAGDALVLMPGKVGFFGSGAVVAALAQAPQWRGRCWWGGALPQRGYFGATLAAPEEAEALTEAVLAILRATRASG